MSRFQSQNALSRQVSSDNDIRSNSTPSNCPSPRSELESDQVEQEDGNCMGNKNTNTSSTAIKLLLKCQIYHELEGMLVIGLSFKNKNFIGTLLDSEKYKYSAPIRNTGKNYNTGSNTGSNSGSNSHSTSTDRGDRHNNNHNTNHNTNHNHINERHDRNDRSDRNIITNERDNHLTQIHGHLENFPNLHKIITLLKNPQNLLKIELLDLLIQLLQIY